MIRNLLTLFYTLLVGAVWAQSPRTAVVEHFTNTRCSICAANNPAFYQTLSNYPQVLHIAFHPSAPYVNCLFSQQNKTENDARTNFYNAYGSTPKVAVQGKLLPASNPIITATTLDTVVNQTSPIEISAVEEFVAADSIRVTIVVRTTGSIGAQNVLLFAGVTEDPVFYNAPNGETVHHDVFRKALTAVTGDVFAPATAGDSVMFEFGYQVKPSWIISQLRTLVFVQLSDTKEILNAAASVRLSSPLGGKEAVVERRNVYPNPASTSLFVRCAENETQAVQIINILGEVVWSGMPQTETIVIDIKELINGVYFLRTGERVTRFIKASR